MQCKSGASKYYRVNQEYNGDTAGSAGSCANAIRFWNENSFAAGEIRLADDLDDHVKFLYSDDNEYFALVVDEDDPSILYITNVKEIPRSAEVCETFGCEFSIVAEKII